MAKKILYQTLADKGNPDYVEKFGPFPCKWHNTWLGDGYYFWDTFISNAHWWGTTRHKDSYMICNAYCDYNTDKCLDLVGTTEHLEFFGDYIKQMKAKGLLNAKTTVARVIEFIKKVVTSFVYEAIRVYGVNSISAHFLENETFIYRMPFETGKAQYLDITPPIQICIFSKNGLDLKNFKVIYPDEYNNDYLV